MFDMDEVIDAAIELIQDGILDNAEAMDAMVANYDLEPGERRQLIYFMAQKGYKYND